jgi:hypothetical protein
VAFLPISENDTEDLAMRILGLSTVGERGRSRRARPRLELLEARALLSHADTSLSAALPAAKADAATNNQVAILYKESLHQHPLMQTISGGDVQKVPMFYSFYKGQRQPDLDVIGATGRLLATGGFVFTGKVLGAINTSQHQFYVFGVNRGSATEPGPFPDRPMIVFDAEVIVTTSSDGVAGTVELLDANGNVTSTISLQNNWIDFRQNLVRVNVPALFLPSKSPPGTPQPQAHFSYAFWAGKSPSVPNRIAGFAPEFANTSIAAPGTPTG